MGTFSLKAEIHFEILDDAELAGVRTKAKSFVAVHEGASYNLDSSDDGETFWAKLSIETPAASRAQLGTLEGQIDTALETMPVLYFGHGPGKRYVTDEREVEVSE